MDVQGRGITPLKSLTLDLPPSCIEFCPSHPDYFVVGTYNLQKEDKDETGAEADITTEADDEPQQIKKAQTRNGSLVLFKLLNIADIKHVQTVVYPSAILDLHFHPSREKSSVLAVVSSTGTLSFFNLSVSEGSSASLNEIITHKPLGDDEGVLFLSCSWHPHIPELLAVTTSNYEVHILRVTDLWDTSKTCDGPVITHTLEAWTVAFSSLTPARPIPDEAGSSEENYEQFAVFSGGDDSKLLTTNCAYYPARHDAEGDLIEASYPPIVSKGHGAGVTAILPLNLRVSSHDSIVVTGSYDDYIRVYTFDERRDGMPPYRPKLLAEQNLQGGVWRLKLIRLEEAAENTEDENQPWKVFILASCMHAGSRVLEISGSTDPEVCGIKVLGRVEEHKSMNYGSDFQPGSEVGDRNLRCVSTSFYDKLLCLWEY
ncbi:uncharacterized protein F4812DRAFT_448492 [Daldinia caldariorum]|uniref:uncharacterized protein n=1 Tax=Daldinia caldariorum TaxID=326644 RepID=UPI0020085A9A|nr:uncharacterized protein F4812DRAFT_448492 [Daldinia caldariorum]KAI1462990.1 hypothetical protein F4812DRAFT_448492 [Daldinia caldariorum]